MQLKGDAMAILVAYTTRNGSTAEVADAVAGALRYAGAEVDLRPAADVWDLERVHAVVLGAPLYNMRWDKPARQFLKRHRTQLLHLPVAVFALGPRSSDAEAFARSRGQLDRALARVPWLAPVAVEVFGGVDPPRKHDRRDIRDWDAIRAWSHQLRERLAS